MITFKEYLTEAFHFIRYDKNKGLLCNRVGSPNAQKQTHKEGNIAPVSRGIWVWPWPLNDYFFSSHQAKNYLKKGEDFVSDEKWKLLRKREMKTKQLWWNKPIYSHLSSNASSLDKSWYLWTDLKDLSQLIEKEIGMIRLERAKMFKGVDGHVDFPSMSMDHLELFLPMTGQDLQKWK